MRKYTWLLLVLSPSGCDPFWQSWGPCGYNTLDISYNSKQHTDKECLACTSYWTLDFQLRVCDNVRAYASCWVQSLHGSQGGWMHNNGVWWAICKFCVWQTVSDIATWNANLYPVHHIASVDQVKFSENRTKSAEVSSSSSSTSNIRQLNEIKPTD